MLPLQPTPVTLDRERTIAFTQRAQYRMGTLERPFDFKDLSSKKKSYPALVAWVWACLTPDHAPDFPTPEELAEHVTRERIAPLLKALAAAVTAAEVVPKNAGGSTGGRGRSSSS